MEFLASLLDLLGLAWGRAGERRQGAGRPQSFFFFLPYCLAGESIHAQNLFYLVILDPYIRERRLFFLFQLGFIAAAAVVVTVVLYPPFGISLSSWLLQSKPGIYDERKPRELTTVSFLVLRSLVDPPSPPHIVTGGKKRKRSSTLSSQKQTCPYELNHKF